MCALVGLSREATEYAILTHDGTTLRKVVTSSDSAPAPAGSVFGRGISLAGINDAGDVAFTAPMTPLGWPVTGPFRWTVFIAPAGNSPVRLMGPGDPVPDSPGRTFDQISGAQFNNRGEVLFRAAIVGGTGGFGYFVAAQDGAGGVDVRKIVATGDSDLRGGFFDAALITNGVRLTNAGQVACVNNNALYISSPGAPLTLVAAQGTPMPATSPVPLLGRSVWGISSLGASFNDSGDVTFVALLTGPPGNTAILRYTAGTTALEVLAYRGQIAPGTIGQTFYTFSNLLMNSAGDVTFYSAMAPNTPTGGLFKVSGGTIAPVVLDGQAAPSPPGGTYRNTAYSRLLDDGSVYFESELSGSPARYGAFLVTASELRMLASNGDPLPPGSRVVFRDLFMGGAGSYTMFEARRLGTDKGGRRYIVRLTVHDVSGNATTASVTIIVPHSQGK